MSEKIVEQIVAVPKVIFPECLSERIVELIEVAPMPQIKEQKTHPSSATESTGLPFCRTVHIRAPSVRAPPRLKVAWCGPVLRRWQRGSPPQIVILHLVCTILNRVQQSFDVGACNALCVRWFTLTCHRNFDSGALRAAVPSGVTQAPTRQWTCLVSSDLLVTNLIRIQQPFVVGARKGLLCMVQIWECYRISWGGGHVGSDCNGLLSWNGSHGNHAVKVDLRTEVASLCSLASVGQWSSSWRQAQTRGKMSWWPLPYKNDIIVGVITMQVRVRWWRCKFGWWHHAKFAGRCRGWSMACGTEFLSIRIFEGVVGPSCFRHRFWNCQFMLTSCWQKCLAWMSASKQPQRQQ